MANLYFSIVDHNHDLCCYMDIDVVIVNKSLCEVVRHKIYHIFLCFSVFFSGKGGVGGSVQFEGIRWLSFNYMPLLSRLK